MAEALRNHYGQDVPRRIATTIQAVYPEFNARAFVSEALDGYTALALMQRAQKIADALQVYLPADYSHAVRILLDSLDQPTGMQGKNPLASFLYLPHTLYVAQLGLNHFDLSMRAQHALTQRFTAEISIRPFIERYPVRTLKMLTAWAADSSEHVRRLVSEGTRPRLPWAPRLRAFQKDPRPVLALLELLKDDGSLYVRRSVANNLNDIGKDHPDLLFATAERWLKNASDHRRWIVRHALRSAVKRGEQGALRVLGFGSAAKVTIRQALVSPGRVKKGATVTLAFEVTSTAPHRQRLVVDLRVHYVRANGKANAKVFKLRSTELGAGATESFSKRLSLKDLTTRKHYAGTHKVEAFINGRAMPLGKFDLMDE
ncbi:MAG: DNA alkylation repair protein [Burkholderiales bacterium]